MRRRLLAVVMLGLLIGCAPKEMRQVNLTAPAYDDETKDYSLSPIRVIRTSDFEAPTPTGFDGATVITVPQPRDMLVSSPPPFLIDAFCGNQTISLPGAIWIRTAGLGNSRQDQLQTKFSKKLAEMTCGDKAKPIAFFCLSKTFWLSYNATLRAVTAGYSHVYWYRGGRDAGQAAGLPMESVHLDNL